MFERFADLGDKLADIEGRLADPSLVRDQKEYQRCAREHAQLSRLHELYQAHQAALEQTRQAQAILWDDGEDAELREMARGELEELEGRARELERELKLVLLPKDPNDDKNIFLEIRAGTGGDEAALFAGDLFRMYGRFAETMGWRVEVMSSNPSELGGFKEIIALISGEQVYSRLKFESGAHRVQRVPETETQGRIHTSAVTVAILPEVDEVELTIDPSELRIDTYRASGAGGQHVNKTDSAIRITHLPTGLVVACQDERSQHKNKAKALTVLRARLLDRIEQERQDKISEDRKNQVGSGDRSERIRTYNFPQGRVTDHRINLTLYQLETVMNGKLDDIILPLIAHDQAERLKEIQ